MKRKRITITIRDDVIKQADRLIDGLQIRSRSQAVEYLLVKILSSTKINTALILAGGDRKEMSELNKNIQRCMLLIKGKPILQHIIERLESYNISNFIIYVDHLGKQIMDYFGDGSTFGVKIKYLVGDRPRGTIYPLILVKKEMRDTFIVVYGDIISSLDIDDFLKFHRESQSLATVALTSVSNPKDYGIVNIKGNKITLFEEKPANELDSFLVSAGIFIFEPRIFNYISNSMQSIERDLFPILVKKNILVGYPFQGMWLNINTPKDLQKARILL